MAPKAGKKAKKTATKSKPRANQTNALLKQVLAALGGNPSARAAPHARRVPSQRFPDYFGASRQAYTPEEYLESNNYDGRQYARINCPAGKLADYEAGKCVDGHPFLGRCKKNEYPDPWTGKCGPYINPRVGYTYVNGEWVHTGVPMDNSSAWNYAKTRLPTSYAIGSNKGLGIDYGNPNSNSSGLPDMFGNFK